MVAFHHIAQANIELISRSERLKDAHSHGFPQNPYLVQLKIDEVACVDGRRFTDDDRHLITFGEALES